MPFTLAHPAIILPLGNSRFNLSLTALIAGSIVPDFEFFLQMKESENAGHHWYGVLLFDLPVALLFCYIFHNILKIMLVANLPAYFRNRFIPMQQFNWNQFAAANKIKVLVSLFIGVITHLLWDGFTHVDGLFVDLWPFLSTSINIASYDVPVYYLLQILCSLGGMIAVGFVVLRLPVLSYASKGQHKHKYFWPLLLLLFTLIISVRIVGWPQYNSFWSVIMACMGGFTYAWILGTFIIKQFAILKNKS